ncbi:hypothetical protein [Christiangramia echinicola]|uniref:hypothetical protein n=1 Tax=Christiangramia echinicola TaxID=279359 RepID=UPI0012EC2307|nr:hypothetical protein [Christiangramia echinicola]
MDKSSLMIGTMLFFIFMFPIIYVLLNQRSKEAKLKKELIELASTNDLKLDKFETLGHLTLGLDSTKKMLLVLDPKMDVDRRVIDLKEISQVRITKNTLREQSKKERIIHLGLELADRDTSKITEIIFYDEDDHDSTDAEIRLNEAKRWDDLLQKNLAV